MTNGVGPTEYPVDPPMMNSRPMASLQPVVGVAKCQQQPIGAQFSQQVIVDLILQLITRAAVRLKFLIAINRAIKKINCD